MIVIGVEGLAEKLKVEPLRQHKALLNETGIVIFAASTQHASVKMAGISYADDYSGSALAAIFDATKFEVRWHRDFADDRVKLLVRELWRQPELMPLKDLRVTYQGRSV